MITKAQIKNSLDSLPENVTIEKVIEHLVFLDKVNKGLDDSVNGRVNTVEEARRKLIKFEMKKTLVIGASENPERYSYKAIKALVLHNHSVVALGLKKGSVDGVSFHTEKEQFEHIDTVTLYIGPQNQPQYYSYIIGLKPRRVIFNPGTENPEFIAQLKSAGIYPEIACTLVLLATGQYE